jgi:hypothetical protein
MFFYSFQLHANEWEQLFLYYLLHSEQVPDIYTHKYNVNKEQAS